MLVRGTSTSLAISILNSVKLGPFVLFVMMEQMIIPSEYYMREAIRQAQLGNAEGDYAIGAVVVQDDKILVACNSRSKRDESPVAHAETLALIEASKILGSRHMPGCILYSTHEPCPMCTSVSVFAKLKGIVYGAYIEDMRAFRLANSESPFLWRTIDIDCEEIIRQSTEHIELVKGYLREECKSLFHS